MNDSYTLDYDDFQCVKSFDKKKYRDVIEEINDDDSIDDDVNLDNFNIDDESVSTDMGMEEDVDLNFDNFNIDAADNEQTEQTEQRELVKDGTNLNEYFLKKLKVNDSNLFTYEAKDGYTSYSRIFVFPSFLMSTMLPLVVTSQTILGIS